MPPLTSQYQRSVSPQVQTPATPVQAQVKTNTPKQQRYAAIGNAIDSLTNLAVNKAQEQHRQEQADKQALDSVSATIGLEKESAKISKWLENPNNLGDNFADSFAKFQEQEGTTDYTDNAQLNTRVSMRAKAAFEKSWGAQKLKADKQDIANKAYEQGVDMVTAQTKDNPMDYGMYRDYMSGTLGMAEEEQAASLLLLGNQDPRAWKYIKDNKIGSADQQATATVKLSSISDKGAKLTVDESFAIESIADSGDTEQVEAILKSGVYDISTDKQKSLIRTAYTKRNQREADIAATKLIIAGESNDDIRDGLPKEQFTHKDSEGNDLGVGRIDMSKYMTDSKIKQLINKTAKEAVRTNNIPVLTRLRKRPEGIPFELKQIESSLGNMIKLDGTLSSSAEETLNLLTTYKTLHGSTGAVSLMFSKDYGNAISSILNRVDNGENVTQVLLDVGSKTRDGTMKYGVKNSTWTSKGIVDARQTHLDDLTPNQRVRVETRADELGKSSTLDVDDAYKQAVDEVKSVDGLAEGNWLNPFAKDINIIKGKKFLTQTSGILFQESRDPDPHALFDWWLDESVRLAKEDGRVHEKANLILAVNDGQLVVMDPSKGISSPLVAPMSVREVVDDYLSKNPKLKQPK